MKELQKTVSCGPVHRWAGRVVIALLLAFGAGRSVAQLIGEPISPQWYPSELMAWSPATDPDAPYNRSTVPLAGRFLNPAFNLNSHARVNEARVTTLSAFNTIPASSAQGSRTTRYFTPTFWQYMETLSFWGGSDRDTRIILVPNGHIVDAAHRNGVPVLGKVFFGWGTDTTRLQRLREFLQKSGNTFPMADKLIEVANYFRFEGWFINQETFGGNSTDAVNMRDFILYFRSRAPHLEIMWYDAMAENGSVSFQNEFNTSNDWYMKYGSSLVAHTMFLNFWWGSSYGDSTKMPNSRSRALSLGLDPYDIYAGIDTEGGGYYTSGLDWENLFPEGQPHRISLGIYRPEWTFNSSSGFADFLARDSRYWVGANGDPSNTATTESWKGLAHYIPARTVITNVPFTTAFNVGVGTNYFIDGAERMRGDWNNLGLQDILPTWRWALRSTGAKLTPTLEWGDAYNGGSCLRISGTLSATNELKLYQTSLAVANDTKLRLVYKRGVAGTPSYMQVGLAFEDSPGTITYYDVGSTTVAGWNTALLDIGAQAGRRIGLIALRFGAANVVQSYNVRVGLLSVYNGQVSTPEPPLNVALDRAYNLGWTNFALKLKWDHAAQSRYYYSIFRRNPDQSRSWLGGTANNAFYFPEIKRIGSEPAALIEIETVGNDFGSSAPAVFAFNWADPVALPLVANDAPGQSSFASGLHWEGGLIPASTNLCVVSGYDLRTPSANQDWTFGGGALVLSNLGRLYLSGTGNNNTASFGLTAPNGLFLDNGIVSVGAGIPQAVGGYVTLNKGGGIMDPRGSVLTISAAVGGSGRLMVEGPAGTPSGTVLLTAPNTYTGGTVINSTNTLRLSGSGTLGTPTSSLAISNTAGRGFGLVDLNGTSQTINNLTGTGGTIANNAGSGNSTLTIGAGNATGVFFGRVTDRTTGSGTISLTKAGVGTISLAGAGNRCSGGVSVTGGTLTVPNTGSLTVGSGSSGTLSIGSGDFNSGTVSGTLDLTSAGDFKANVEKVEVGVNRATSGNASWSGILKLGTNTYLGATSSIVLGGSAGAFPGGLSAQISCALGGSATFLTPSMTVAAQKCSVNFSIGSGARINVGSPSTRTALGIGDPAPFGGNGTYNGSGSLNLSPGIFNGVLRKLVIASLDHTGSGGQVGSMVIGSHEENHLDIAGAGPLVIIGTNSAAGTGTATGTLTVGNLDSASVIVASDNGPAILIGAGLRSSGTLNLNAGRLKITTTGRAISGGGGLSTLTLNGVTLVAGASSANFISGLSAAQLRAGGVTFDTAGFNITVPQALINSGGGGLTKTGAGKLTLTGANTYSGTTMVSGGSLALSGAGAISSSAGVAFQNEADLDLTGKPDRTLVLSSGRFLKGTGRVIGNVSAAAGSTIEPGNGIGNLTILGNVGLAGTLTMELDRGAGQACDRLVCAGGTVTGGGALVVTNIGPSLAVGDVFRLFEVPVSGFAEISLPGLPAGLGWTNGIATDGTIAVIARAARLLPIAVVEGKVKMAWDPGQIGWHLQSQTNAPGTGLSGNWTDLPESAVTNEWLVPIDPNSGSVFFRLVYP